MKIAVVTSYDPASEEAWRGRSTFQTLRRMPPEAGIAVFCPWPLIHAQNG
jgi:hypothetical protein